MLLKSSPYKVLWKAFSISFLLCNTYFYSLIDLIMPFHIHGLHKVEGDGTLTSLIVTDLLILVEKSACFACWPYLTHEFCPRSLCSCRLLGHSQLHHLFIIKPLSGKKTPPSVLSMFFHVGNGASLPWKIPRYALFSVGRARTTKNNRVYRVAEKNIRFTSC